MLRLYILAIAMVIVTPPNASAQGEVWKMPVKPLTTLGTYDPNLDQTLTALAKRHAEAPDTEHSIASAAWQALAFSGMGSGMRSGRYKKPLRTLVIWLTNRQAEFHETPHKQRPSRIDSILMSLTFARIGSESNYKLLGRFIDWSMEMWLPQLAEEDAQPLDDDETLLLALLAQTLRDTKFRDEQKQVLALAQQAIAKTPVGKNRRADSVRHFLEVAAGKSHPPELTAATCCPANELADPLHAWLGAFSIRTLPESIRTSHRDRNAQLIGKLQKNQMWPASGKYDETTTTAMMLATIGMTRIRVSPPKAKNDPVPKPKGNPWNGPIK